MVPRPDAEVAEPGRRLHALGDHEGGEPEADQDHGAHVEPVAGQVGSTERGGQRGGTEREQRGVEGHAVHEDEPGGLEAGAVAERLADPDEDAALVAGRELGRDQAHGEQEEDGRDQVDRDRRRARTSRSPRAGRCSRHWRPSSSPGPATRSARPTVARRRRTRADPLVGACACHVARSSSVWPDRARRAQPVVVGGVDVGDEVVVRRQLVRAVGLHDQPLVGDRVGGDQLLRADPTGCPCSSSDSAELTPSVEDVADLRSRRPVEGLGHTDGEAAGRRRPRGRRTPASRRRTCSCAPCVDEQATSTPQPAPAPTRRATATAGTARSNAGLRGSRTAPTTWAEALRITQLRCRASAHVRTNSASGRRRPRSIGSPDGGRSAWRPSRYTIGEGPDGSRTVQIHARGMAVLDDPQVNRGTAFTRGRARPSRSARAAPAQASRRSTEQVARCYEQFKAKRLRRRRSGCS